MGSYERSALHDIEGMLNASFGGRFVFRFAKASCDACQRLLAGAAPEKVATGATVSAYGVGGKLGKPAPVTFADIEQTFTETNFYNGSYTDIKDFARALQGAILANLPDRKAARAERVARTSDAQEMLCAASAEGGEISISYDEIPLNTAPSSVMAAVSDIDKAFTLKHLLKDAANQIYWRFDKGDVLPVPVLGDKDANKIAHDPAFWERWLDDNAARLQGYIETIIEFSEMFREGNATRERDAAKSELGADYSRQVAFEATLSTQIPRFILNSISLSRRWIKSADEKKRFDGIRVRLKAGGTPTAQLDRASWQQALCLNMLQSMPLSLLSTITVFSNSTQSAIHLLRPCPRIEFDIKAPTPPELEAMGCKAWGNFFHSVGVDNNTKFPSQRMGELRFAKWLVSLLSSQDTSRQMLCVFGEGNDGKSVCFDAIARGLGYDKCKTGLAQDVLESNFGLQNCINSRLLVFDDIQKPYEFMNSDKIKRISGAGMGSLQVDQKYKAPYTWFPSGCKIVMSTNNNLILNDEASITRCLPLVFTRNYKRSAALDTNELVASLASEVEDGRLFAWAWATCHAYTNVINAVGERCPLFTGIDEKKLHLTGEQAPFIGKALLVCTDAQFEAWCRGDLDLLPDDEAALRSLRQAAFEDETTISHRAVPFVRISQDTAADENETSVIIDTLISFMFERGALEFTQGATIAETLILLLNSKTCADCQAAIYARALGFADKTTVRALARSSEYTQLLNRIMQIFDIDKPKPHFIKGKTVRGYTGIKLRDMRDIIAAQKQTPAIEAQANNGFLDDDMEVPF